MEAGPPGASVLPQVLPQAPVRTALHCYQALLHHQDHSRGSSGIGSGAKACMGPNIFPHIDNVKLPEAALPIISSVGKVFPLGDFMETASRKHLFCPPPPSSYSCPSSSSSSLSPLPLLLCFSPHLSFSLWVSGFLTFAHTFGLVFLLTDHPA